MNQSNEGLEPEDFVAKIADFGLTAEADTNLFNIDDKMGQITGTILYMAPEQGTGQRYGKRIDLWAIGIIMFQILTGKHPFYLQNDNEKTYIERISKDKIDEILE